MTDADDTHDAADDPDHVPESREDTDDTEPAHDHDSAADVGHDVDEGRTTAPMSEFTSREVGIGFVVLAIGLVLAFAIPILAL